ncbi:unnamed protein product, partial [Cladocopium goreaui]
MARRWTDITSDDEDVGVFLARLWPQPLQHAGPIAAPVPGALQQRGRPPRRVRDAQRATGGPFLVLLLAFLRGLGDPSVSKHSLHVLQGLLQAHPRTAERTHGTLVYDLIFFSSLDHFVKVDHVTSYLRAFWSGSISWEALALWHKFLQIECYVDFACPVLS